jgi:hypothetical protein
VSGFNPDGIGLKKKRGGVQTLIGMVIGLAWLGGTLIPAWSETVTIEGKKVSVKRDPLTKAPLTIRGEGTALLEIKNISKINRDRITKVGPLLVKHFQKVLSLEPEDLRLKAAEKVDDTWYVSYWQTVKGVIIYESSLGFSIDPRGRIHSLGALLYPKVQVPGNSKISRDRALTIARSQVPDYNKSDYRLLADSLLIYPERKADRVTYYLVYACNFFPQKALHPASVVGGWAVFVDTQTGKVIFVQTLFKPLGCCVPENWTPPKPEELYKGIFGN